MSLVAAAAAAAPKPHADEEDDSGISSTNNAHAVTTGVDAGAREVGDGCTGGGEEARVRRLRRRVEQDTRAMAGYTGGGCRVPPPRSNDHGFTFLEDGYYQ